MGKVISERRVIEQPEIVIPDKVSELLREVVADMRAVAAMKNVKFDMKTWIGDDGDVCTVCAAGAWLLNKFVKGEDIVDVKRAFYSMRTSDVGVIMAAVDYLRGTDVETFLVQLEGLYPDIKRYCTKHRVNGNGLLDSPLFNDLEACFPAGYDSSNYQSVVTLFEKCATVLEQHNL